MNETWRWMMQQITTLVYGGAIQSEPYLYFAQRSKYYYCPVDIRRHHLEMDLSGVEGFVEGTNRHWR